MDMHEMVVVPRHNDRLASEYQQAKAKRRGG